LCYVDVGLGRRRRAETDSILPFPDACVRAYVCASAVPPQLQNRRNNDSDTTVGGKAKSTTHTPVPEALYQIEMLARIRELRESSQGHDNDSSR
jgi:hypothetical protein